MGIQIVASRAPLKPEQDEMEAKENGKSTSATGQ